MNKRSLKEYRIWKAMKSRCNSPSSKKGIYKNLNVCERWLNSYDNFIKDMGQIPSNEHSIDRIDNTKGYYLENCRWVSQDVQCKNRGNFNKIFTYNNQTLVLKDWAKVLNIKYSTLWMRIYRSKLTFEQAIYYDNSYEYNGYKGTLKDICKKFSNLDYQLVVDRLHRKWTLHDSLTINKQI